MIKRRQFIKKTFLGLTGVGLLSGLYAWQVEPFWLEFVKIKMPIKNLPDNLVGKTLMQISDIHIGKRFDPNFVIDSFKKANAFNPDFVVYTGDFVSTHQDLVQYAELEQVIKNSVKGAVKHINNFEDTAANIAIDRDYDYVVCGHIHQPCNRKITNCNGSVTYLNSGDWIENLTALEYTESEWNLYHYQQDDLMLQRKDSLHQAKETHLRTAEIFKIMMEDFVKPS